MKDEIKNRPKREVRGENATLEKGWRSQVANGAKHKELQGMEHPGEIR